RSGRRGRAALARPPPPRSEVGPARGGPRGGGRGPGGGGGRRRPHPPRSEDSPKPRSTGNGRLLYRGNGYINQATASPPSTSETISVPKSFQRSRFSFLQSSEKNADTSRAYSVMIRK